jgi:hypothetical protein
MMPGGDQKEPEAPHHAYDVGLRRYTKVVMRRNRRGLNVGHDTGGGNAGASPCPPHRQCAL